MDESQQNFWLGAGVGTILIAIIDLLVPFLGPIVGGFAAGYIAKGDAMRTGTAGVIAGILAAAIVAVYVYAGMISHPVAGYIPAAGTGFFLYVALTLYLAIFGFLGGVIAGVLRK